ncbi:hypothetical protein F5Y03DRAFT_399758 [Xylaria venustula]|nr:hypothetical protein F5Y03DRAFT_399758 [Xylaria venustula]
MLATIDSLPVELVAHVATYLHFHQICSLRLASRTLAAKLCPENLPRLFAYKTVKLDYQSLNDFIYMTSPDRAGCVLKHCTITNTLVREPRDPAFTRLLNKAFVNLKRNSPRAGLVSLCVNVDLPPSSWANGVPSAWYTAQMTMAALRECHLSVSEHLRFSAAQECSLPYRNALPLITQLASSTTVFSSLKKLTMGLCSTRAPKDYTSGAYFLGINSITDVRQSMHGSCLLRGLLIMLESMPRLEELDIHWYNVRTYPPTAEDGYMDLEVAAAIEPLHINLKACSFRGLYIPVDDLLQYLKAVQPAKLTLTDVRLVSGTWTHIFEYLSSTTSPITSYHLDDLYESDGLMVHFDDVPGQSKFPYRGVQMGPSTLTRRIGEVGKRIRYQCTTRTLINSRTMRNWVWSKTMEFGAWVD